MNTKRRNKRDSSSWLILIQDCMVSTLSSLLSVLLVRWLSEPLSGYTQIVFSWLGCAVCASLCGSVAAGSHKVVRRHAASGSLWRTVRMVVVKESLLSVVLLSGLVHLPSLPLSVLSVLCDALLTVLLLSYMRFAARAFTREEVVRVKAEAGRRNALVVGTDAASVSLAREVVLGGDYNVVGYVSRDAGMAGRVIGETVVYHCESAEDLERLEWRLGGVDCVFIPKRPLSGGPSSRDGGAPGDGNAVPYAPGMGRTERALKRGFDVVLSGVLMAVFSPLALLSALAVKLEDGEAVLYRQERIGRNGKPFQILKFRSMRPDAEVGGAQLYSGEGDPRLTRVGRFLREHHLDELPQLWNVFKGDMSFIGPRPERRCYIEQIAAENPRYTYLYQIRPGVTSYATLYNGYTDTLEKMLTRLDLDLYYLRNRSIGFDLHVLGMTFLSIVSGKKF